MWKGIALASPTPGSQAQLSPATVAQARKAAAALSGVATVSTLGWLLNSACVRVGCRPSTCYPSVSS